MDILVFKILTDVCFYMAMFMPLFLSGPLWVRVLLFLALASWCVWLLICWKKRNMEERAHDSLMTEARLLLAAGCIQWLSLGTEVWGRRCVPFFTAFLVLGIFLLRALRLARTGQGRGGFWGRTAGELLAVLAAALALTLTGGREIALTAGGGASVELPEEGGLVALTFDDGPRPSTTGRLLDGLALRELPATFFLVGSRLAGDPEGQALVRRMAAEGHQIGVHTFDHVMLTDLSRRDYDVQVGRTRALLAQIAGPGDYWLRPPYGITDQAAEQWAASPLILWSVDPEDWKDRDVHRIVSAVTEHVKDGDIILLHDIYDSSVDAALAIADNLTARGFTFVTVEQLATLRGASPQVGVKYHKFPAGG